MSASRKSKGTWLLVAGLVLLLTISLSRQGFADSCFYEDFSKYGGWDERPTTGDDYAFAIYCSGPDVPDLPKYWLTAWGPYGYSIEGFFLTMSDEAYRLHCDPCAYGNRPYSHPDLEPVGEPCYSGASGFADSILMIADDYINYADYDKDTNGVVDGFFFVIISTTLISGGCDHVDCMYTSSDTNANGDSVVVDGDYGVEILIWRDMWGSYTKLSWFKQICVHEWGHQFGLTDLYGGHTVGGYSAMSNTQFPWYPPWPAGGRCSPYDPHSRIKLGWVTPTTVWGTVSDQPILDHISTGQVYKLPSSAYSYDHFLVSNHTNDSYWQEYYPGQGLLIWHITPGGKNWVPDTIPEVDVEGAEGLWDFGEVPPVRNDSIGQDSIDCCGPGFYTNFWNNNTKTCFDDTSSPNTRNYIMDGSLVKQTIYTGVWVRNIQGDPGDDTLYADMFAPVSHWGPDTIVIYGDTVIPDGHTVSIHPDTRIKFDTTDSKSSGYDTTRCELIVKGKLVARGIGYEPPGPTNIYFESLSSSPQPGDWYGIVVDTGGCVDMREAQSRHAYAGVYLSSMADSNNLIRNCTFRENEEYGIKALTGNVELKSNRVIGPSDGVGIYVDAPQVCCIRNKIDSAGTGIYIMGPYGESTIYKNEIYGPGNDGMIINVGSQSRPPYTHISQCKINGFFCNTHLYLAEASFIRVDTCELLTGGEAGIEDCSPVGIRTQEECDSLKVRNTTIRDYSEAGVEVSEQSIADLGVEDDDPGNNYIATRYEPPSGRVYAVVNLAEEELLLAQENYWGADPPPDTIFKGPVEYEPWLSEPRRKIHAEQSDNRPKKFALLQNYPNPFNPNTIMRFKLPEACKASVRIYNVLGQLVRTVVDEDLSAGDHTVIWDGSNQSGEQVASGIYFYVLKAGDLHAARKMVLLR